jgi:hypothetical protein
LSFSPRHGLDLALRGSLEGSTRSWEAGVGEEAGVQRRGRSGRPAPGMKRAAGAGEEAGGRDILFLYLFIRWGIEEDHCVVKK